MAMRQMQIAHRGRDMAVAEQSLKGGQIHPGFEQVSGEAVPQGVDAALRADAGGVPRGAVDALHRLGIDRRRPGGIGEQPAPRPAHSPVSPQGVEQARRQQRVAILSAFALKDSDPLRAEARAESYALAYLETHPIRCAFDVRDLQSADFRDAQASGVGRH